MAMPTATTCAIAPTRDATAACSLAKYDADVLESSCFARKRFGGFTLIELMIVVAVVAILTKIAYPSYLEYMKRGYRSAAQGFMLDLANREQQYLLDGVPTEVSAYYTVTITATAGPPPTFEVKASPLSGSILAGETPFTIDQDGTRLPSGKWQGR
jgi:type IV pilus assembly protein PilE